jgi:hypothetical protein
MLARKLRGFENCDAQTIYRHFIQGKGTITVKDGKINVAYPRRAHNPILRAVPWKNLPTQHTCFPDADLSFTFA